MGFEARLKFKNPDQVWEKIQAKTSVKEEYESEDFFFQPKGKNWSIKDQNMRVRVGFKGPISGTTQIIYRENVWKNGIHEEKVSLKISVASAEEAFSILDNWSFEKILSYKKKGKSIAVAGRKEGFVWEEIEHVGILAEIPGESDAEVKELTEQLFDQEDYEVVEKVVPELVMEVIKNAE